MAAQKEAPARRLPSATMRMRDLQVGKWSNQKELEANKEEIRRAHINGAVAVRATFYLEILFPIGTAFIGTCPKPQLKRELPHSVEQTSVSGIC